MTQTGKGSLNSGEAAHFTDAATGATIHQLTNHPSISHPSYFLQRSFLPGDRSLIFVSYRAGSPQLFEAAFPDGPIRQLTEGSAIHPFSPAQHPGGESIIFTRGGSIWEVRRDSL